MNNNLLIIGAGQYGHVAKEIAEAMGTYDRIEFIDDHSEIAIGTTGDLGKLSADYKSAIVALGNPELRTRFCNELKVHGYSIATLIHPRAYVSPSAQIAPGCIVEPMAVIHTECILESCVFASAGAIVNHNSIIKEVAHLDVGSIVKARSVVPVGRKLEAGEVFQTNA
ncbi:MAG: hypothetical protein HUJ70_12690 [Pseudobutyrivibrio sp.]|nr:hypothetical protein [Pseudobutyrivibrio sp.]